MPENIRFYAVKVNGDWEIWPKTVTQMRILTNEDRTLGKRMANAPFDTRESAEQWIEQMRKRGV